MFWKIVKICCWIALACFVFTVTLLLVALFTPGVQKAVFLNALNSQPGMRVQVERLRVGLSSYEVKNLYVLNEGQGLQIEAASGSLSLWSLLTRREVKIENLKLRGLLMDLSQGPVTTHGRVVVEVGKGGTSGESPEEGPDAEAGETGDEETPAPDSPKEKEEPAPQPFPGFLALTQQLGYTVRIDTGQMDGRVLLPEKREVTMSGTIEGIAPGQTGVVTMELQLKDPSNAAQVAQAGLKMRIEIVQPPVGGLQSLRADYTLAAQGGQLKEPVAILCQAAIEPAAGGEKWQLHMAKSGLPTPFIEAGLLFNAAQQTVSGKVKLDLHSTDWQPFIAQPLPACHLQGETDLKTEPGAKETSFQSRMVLRSAGATNAAATAQTQQPESSLEIKTTGKMSHGLVEGSAPIVLHAKGRDSDVALHFKLQHQQATRQIELTVSSRMLVLADWQEFASLFKVTAPPAAESPVAVEGTAPAPQTAGTGQPEAPAQPTADQPTGTAASSEDWQPDAKPVWEGLIGAISWDLKRIVPPNGAVEISDCQGRLAIQSERLLVEKAGLRYGNAPVEFSGELAFRAGQIDPYALQGELEAQGVDVGEHFKKKQPNVPPILETVLDAQASVAAEAPNMDVLAERLRGSITVTSGRGVLRPVAAGGEKASQGLALMGVAGQLLGGANKTVASVASVSEFLREIPFDRLELKAARDANLDFQIPTVMILSPDVRIAGQGMADFQPGVPPERWPLNMQLQLAVEGRTALAKRLNDGRLLSGARDSAGFFLGPRFVLSGTIGQPKSNLGQVIAEALARGLLSQPVALP